MVGARSNDSAVHVSVIVPAYREQDRIGRCIEGLTRWLDTQPWLYELIVVDDGSDDGTSSVVSTYCDRDARVKLTSCAYNRGKGYAVRRGLAQAVGDYVMFTDADLSTAPEVIGDALEILESGRADIVVATRARASSELVVRQRWHRESMGRVFNAIARILGLTAIPDTQCGFKAFRAAVLVDLLDGLRVDGFAFDVELLFEADRLGLRVVELPVRWKHHSDSRVHIVSDSARMFLDLIIIAVRARWRPKTVRKEGPPVQQ